MTKVYILKKKVFNGLWYQTTNKKAFSDEEKAKKIVEGLTETNPRLKFEIECLDVIE